MTETRPLIRRLDESVISKIAAGEMILRPFSVAKELLENAIDARATVIDIEVGEAPDRLLVVRDDGIGMTEDELSVALEAHATSKLRDEDDLLEISSLGFRGEALPSIGRVSRLEIVTASDDSGSGVRIRVEGGERSRIEPAPRSRGTTLRVEELFYNSPVRKRFLKSAAGEIRWIARLVQTYAFGFPRLHLRWILRGERKLDLPPVHGLAERIAQVHGPDHLDKLLAVELDTPRAMLHGFVGVPELARMGTQHQTLLVNGRWVTAPWLSAALRQGFGDLLPPGKSPFAVLCLAMEPARVDVNVHPTKREIRFLDESELFGAVVRAVQRQARTLVPTWDLDPANRGGGWVRAGDANASGSLPGIGEIREGPSAGGGTGLPRPWSGGRRERQPSAETLHTLWSGPPVSEAGATPSDSDTDVHTDSGAGGGTDVGGMVASNRADSNPYEPGTRGIESAEEREASPAGADELSRQTAPYWQVHRRYILTQTRESLFVIDQHAAHERILYEQIMDRFESEPLPTQQLVVPLVLELELDELEVFRSCQTVLARVGIDAEEFGGQSVVLRGVPVLWKEPPEAILRELLGDLAQSSARDLEARFERLAANFACRSAIKTGRSLSLREMDSLVTDLFRCRVPHGDPHGRPTYVQVPIDDLDRRFGRH